MRNKLPITCILAVAAICIYLFQAFVLPSNPSGQDPARPKSADAGLRVPAKPSANNSPSTDPSSPGTNRTIDTTNTDPRFTRFTDGTVHLTQSFTTSRRLHNSPDPHTDLEIVTQLLADYRLVYKENPVGTENAEIVAQLLGGNPKKTFFIDPAISALSPEDELLDRWGSPFIFHPLKSDLMDVRSIGPDRKPWTEDDLSLDLKAEEEALLLNSTQ